jgi:hypothetical protein
MKLVSRIINIAEKFNGTNIFISTLGSFKFPDITTAYAISSNRGNATKAVLFFSKDGQKARLVEVDFKVHITAKFGSYLIGAGDLSVTGLTFKDTDDFVRTVTKRYLELLDAAAGMTNRTRQDYTKKAGSGEVTEDTGWKSKEDILKILLKNNVPNAWISRIAEFTGVSISDALEVAGFKLIDTLNTDKKIIEIIKDSAALIKKHGFDKINYGNVYFSHRTGTKRKTVLADYSVNTDDIRIFTTALKDKEENPILSLVHELAHRHYYRILNASQRSAVRIKFSQVMNLTKKNVADKFDLKAGDIVDLKLKKHKVMYKGYTYVNPFGGRKMAHVFRILDDAGQETTRYYSFPLKNEVGMIDFIKTNTEETKTESEFVHKFLPSAYSRTNDVEWYAEVFAHGLYNNDKEVIDWLNSLK